MNRREAIAGMVGTLAAAALPQIAEAVDRKTSADLEQCKFTGSSNKMTLTATLEQGASIWIDGETIVNVGKERMIVTRTVEMRINANCLVGY